MMSEGLTKVTKRVGGVKPAVNAKAGRGKKLPRNLESLLKPTPGIKLAGRIPDAAEGAPVMQGSFASLRMTFEGKARTGGWDTNASFM